MVFRLQLPEDAYTYIVITCGAQTNNAVWTVRRMLKDKGISLDYCHKIRVPDSSAIAFGRNPNDQAWKFERIIADISARKKGLHFSGFDPLGAILNSPSIAFVLAPSALPVCTTARSRPWKSQESPPARSASTGIRKSI